MFPFLAVLSMQHPFNKMNQRAFTLIEMITVIAILMIVGVSLTGTIQYFYKTDTFVVQEGTAVQSAQRGLTIAMKNLREASYGDDGSYPIANAATSTITFYADVDGDGGVEKVTYSLSGKTLYRNITNAAGNPPTYIGSTATDTLATYVVSTTTAMFQYYDSTGTILPSPVDVSQVASVVTTMRIDVDPNRAPTTYLLTSTATLRNLRSQ
jgi:prepilin-type N-terminal cleavage/methylation domain-containing protein